MAKHEFQVKVELPFNVTSSMMAAYIREAIRVYAGSFGPDDPLREIDRKSVVVKPIGLVDLPKKEKRLTRRYASEEVKLSDIEACETTLDYLVYDKLKQDIEQHGVLNHVVLVKKKGAKKYHVRDGRARVRACRELDKKIIPALIIIE